MDKWKKIILSRYLGDYQPGEPGDKYPILKTSEDIKFDLAGMGNFNLEEISAELAARGYQVKIDEDGKPKWILRDMLSRMATTPALSQQ